MSAYDNLKVHMADILSGMMPNATKDQVAQAVKACIDYRVNPVGLTPWEGKESFKGVMYAIFYAAVDAACPEGVTIDDWRADFYVHESLHFGYSNPVYLLMHRLPYDDADNYQQLKDIADEFSKPYEPSPDHVELWHLDNWQELI